MWAEQGKGQLRGKKGEVGKWAEAHLLCVGAVLEWMWSFHLGAGH